ncbi:MAG: DUF3466 family protein [Glaciecola sp.]
MKLNRITASLASTLILLSSAPMLVNAQSYEVVELPSANLSMNQFASSIDNTGLALTIVSARFNQPIDLSKIDLDSVTLTDPEAAAQGDFNATDLAILTSIIYSNTASNLAAGQKLAANTAYSTDGVDTNYVFGFDSESPATTGFSYSLNTTLGDSVFGTHIIGSMPGPFNYIEYTNEEGTEVTYNVNQVKLRGFVQVNNEVHELLPPDTYLGGYSKANAINTNYQVAGVASVDVNDNIISQKEACDEDETRGDIPLEACYYAITTATATSAFTGVTSDSYLPNVTRRAVVWQLDGNGSTLSTDVYGLNFVPDDDNNIIFSNEANAINDLGQAVGVTTVELLSTYSQAAALFENGETVRLLEDDDLLPNTATDINNNSLVTGYRSIEVNGVSRLKLFVYNINTGELTLPDGFFLSSASLPRAINNNDIVVGDAEIDTENRRRNGFLYDISNDDFSNINDLIACDSDYEIIAANDINDNDEIIAEALVKRPLRDAKGEIFLDEDGEQVLQDAVIAVKLLPTGDSPETCELSDDEAAAIERQGASMPIILLVSLAIFGLFRRYKTR